MTRCAANTVIQREETPIGPGGSCLAVAVAQSRLVAFVGWLVVTAGAASVACGLSWLGLPLVAVGLGAGIPLLAHKALYKRSWPVAADLLARPGGSWRLPDGREGALAQAWHHTFGLTLTFNCAQRPHNPPERLTLTIWRCNVPAETYRRLSVMVAWQLLRPGKVFIRETV